MSNVLPLVKQIQEARQSYANGKRIIPDAEYDELEENLRRLDPNNPILLQVGAKIEAGEAVKLPIPMPSLIKIKPTELPDGLPSFLQPNTKSVINLTVFQYCGWHLKVSFILMVLILKEEI